MNDDLFMSRLKELYHPPQDKFTLIDVPEIRYMAIDGKGDPQQSGIQEAMQWLWSIAHFILPIAKQHLGKKFAYPPLECLFWADNPEDFANKNQAKWRWRAMIVLASFFTEEMFVKAVSQTEAKKQESAPESLRIIELNEGQCVQRMHLGDYQQIETLCEQLYHNFLPDQQLTTNGYYHEIYLNDPSRTPPKKRKVVIRQPVK